jgi:predicted permease
MLGIGATTAIFSIVNVLLLRPVGIPDPESLVVLSTTSADLTGDGDASSPAKFQFWRTRTTLLHDVSAALTTVMNYTGGEIVEQWHSMKASADAFRCTGTPILQGRGFTQDEDRPHGPLVALISNDLWHRRFGGDPRILGTNISLNGEQYSVIGIAGDSAVMRLNGPPPEVYVPFQLNPNSNDQGAYFAVMARLNSGVSLERARAEIRVSINEYRGKFPGALGPKDGFTIKPLREDILGDTRQLVLVLLSAVSLVLLIACSNVANLLLARAAGRRREIAIRAAIGATRGRMIRQLLTESVLLSTVGGVLGLLMGHAGIRTLLAVNTAGLPMVGKAGAEVTIDWRVLAFALTVSLATGIIFGLLPALQGSRADLNLALKDSRPSGIGLRRNKARAALVVSEVSLAVVLLVGSALLIRSFVALYRVDPGFNTKNVVSLNVLMTGPKYSKSARVASSVRNGLEQIRSVPGVVTASATCCLPLAQGTYDLNFNIVRRPTSLSANQVVGWSPISPGFFDVFRIPLRRGRAFTDRDDSGAPPVVIISESMARQYWEDSDPLGDRLVIGRDAGLSAFKDEPVREIIGIVGDIRSEGLDTKPRPIMYVPQPQLPDAENEMFFRLLPMAWVVRTQADPHALIPSIQQRLRQAMDLPVTDVSTMDHDVWAQSSRQRFNALVMTVFAGAALVLAAIGIYGLMAYTVEQRRHEIGIRMALGADSHQVRGIVVRQGMGLSLAGVMIGISAAWGLARLIESLLYGTKSRDPFVYIAVPIVLWVVALLALWVPANRASRINPIECLRHE